MNLIKSLLIYTSVWPLLSLVYISFLEISAVGINDSIIFTIGTKTTRHEISLELHGVISNLTKSKSACWQTLSFTCQLYVAGIYLCDFYVHGGILKQDPWNWALQSE